MSASLMQAAGEVARLAGAFAHRYWRQDLVVETKGDGSPVTIADRGAEELARDWIGERFPRDGILGEEFGALRPDARRRWIIDPIDGTKSFVRGVPLWGTLVAVADGDDVLAGAIYCPCVDELVVAGLGAGAWWNGARCHVSAVDDLGRATVLTTDERMADDPAKRAGWTRLTGRAGVVRSWGDCYGYVLLATGRAEVMVDPAMHAWDSAAVAPVVTEAGGLFTDWQGRATAWGADAIGTNAALAQAARTALGVPLATGEIR
ncbi:MAG: histidinol-phosphatase [Gemmatimonadetes bacterium]|nr:histidinol-phosphatase [Gemmatimonadota bacterium]